MAGRPRKNEGVKKLQGTSRADREVEQPDFEQIVKIPNPPAHFGLKKEGKLLYQTTASQLAHVGMLNNVNITFVFLYAKEMQKYIDAEKDIKKLGSRMNIIKDSNDNIIKIEQLPLDKMANVYLENARKLANELGITPASAAKVGGFKAKEEKNPFTELMSE